jgi:hypothetical protein
MPHGSSPPGLESCNVRASLSPQVSLCSLLLSRNTPLYRDTPFTHKLPRLFRRSNHLDLRVRYLWMGRTIYDLYYCIKDRIAPYLDLGPEVEEGFNRRILARRENGPAFTRFPHDLAQGNAMHSEHPCHKRVFQLYEPVKGVKPYAGHEQYTRIDYAFRRLL